MKQTIKHISVSFLLALLFSLIFYYFNTPIGPSIGSDNAMYLTMGTALSNGFAPYKEIFDHKGPLLYLLQWIPQAIAGGYSTISVFIMELLFLTCCLFIISKIAALFSLPAFLLQIIYLAMASPLTGGGNLSEEYTNLPSLLVFYLVLSLFYNDLSQVKNKKEVFIKATLSGVCCAFCFLVRANNVLPLFVLLISLSFFLLFSKNYSTLILSAAGTVLGLLILFLPILFWLYNRGVLYDAFYGSILHNFMYAGNKEGAGRIFMLFSSWYGHMALLLFFLSFLGAFALYLQNGNLFLSCSLVFSGLAGLIAAFLSHKYYQHYLMISLPASLTGTALIFNYMKKEPKLSRLLPIVCILCFLPLIIEGNQCLKIRKEDTQSLPEFTQDALSLYHQVPEEEQNRFMAYRVEPKWYVVTKSLPCIRFYFLQEMLAEVNPSIMDEIVDDFNNNPPLWIVIYNKDRVFSPPYDQRMQYIFEHDYEYVDSAGGYQLMKHI